ncbi:MAG: hypothetical protein WDZ96_03185 [Acidimicrobiia bacterium]
MTVTWGSVARRKALALAAAFCLLGSLIIVFSPPALGNGSSPSAECASTNPAWNGDFWKVEKDDGTLSEIETNMPGAITLTANGSWTNNNEDPVFRVVLKIDDEDDDDGDDEQVVLSGIWATGEGGTIDVTLSGLDHVTFCFTSEVAESEPTTTTTSPATTTTAGPTTTTTAVPTTTTTPNATIATLTESTTTTPSDDTITNAAANPTDASDSDLTNDELQGDETVEEAEGSTTDDSGLSPEIDRDTAAAGLTNGGPGEPPTAEQESSSDAAPYVFRSSHQWTLADLAILGALIAAIAGLLARRNLRRLIWHLGERWR